MGALEWATGNEAAWGPGNEVGWGPWNGLLGMRLVGGLGMRLQRIRLFWVHGSSIGASDSPFFRNTIIDFHSKYKVTMRVVDIPKVKTRTLRNITVTSDHHYS